MKKLLLLSPLVLLLASCFHKNVMSDKADDVVYSTVYEGKEGKFIITEEEIFQATSKKSGGGMTSISGYSEYRLTTYDLATGNLVKRVELGQGMDENQTIILGTTEGKLWLYSFDKSIGLHYRNPKTLEVIANQEQLLQKPSLKGIVFSQPEWARLADFYGYDALKNKIMFSDQQGFKYYMDPETFAIEKTENKIPNYGWAKHARSTSGYLYFDRQINFEGEPRKIPQFHYKKKESKLSFLFAELFIDNDPVRDAALKRFVADSLQKSIKACNDTMQQLTAADPKVSLTEWVSSMTDKVREAKDYYQRLKRKAEDLQDDLNDVLKKDADDLLLDDPLLGEDRRSFFIWHATNVGDTCHAIVSKVSLNNDSTFTERWHTTLGNYYYDADKADNAGAFETVFSDGNPDFGYQWQTIADGKLIFISQLRMACLDLKTGKVLWDLQL